MNPLHLSGYGVKIKCRNLHSTSRLEVTDGRDWDKTPSTLRFRPRRFPYSSIIIDGHSGYVSLQAFHWLSRNKVPVFILNYDGSMISSILPPSPVKADLRAAQVKASEDTRKKFSIARSIVQAKVSRNLQVLDWLAQRYDIERAVRLTRQEALLFSRVRSVIDLRTVEGRVALRYWQAYASVIPECFDFHGRMTTSHQNNASDPVNLALNYAYGVLEGEFGIVKELIVRQVATQTFTITTTATLTTTYSSVWGAALAAFIGGICVVLVSAAMVRRRIKP